MIGDRRILCGINGLATLVLVLSGCGIVSSSMSLPEETVVVVTSPLLETPVATPAPIVVSSVATAATAPATADAVATSEPIDELVSLLSDEAWEILIQLTEEFSPRESATNQEKAAADFLVEWFEAMDYEVELQSFTFEFLSKEVPVLTLINPEKREIIGYPMTLSGTGQSTGVLVDVGLVSRDDVLTEGIEGKIALIRRGEITFEEKVARVAEAGALAAVVYNNRTGIFGGRLVSQASIPAITISMENGIALTEMMDNGEVVVTVSVIMTTLESRNVIAEMSGASSGNAVVILGAHFDTVPDTQGANDNGSGIATMLTLARVYSDGSHPLTLRFIAFGAEEVGLFGSRHYVSSLSADERDDIVAMLNFDVLGSGETIEVLGDPALVEEILDYGEAQSIEVRRGVSVPGASSDHASFAAVGVPTVFFLADDLSRINSSADNIEFVQPKLMGIAAILGVGLVDSLTDR